MRVEKEDEKTKKEKRGRVCHQVPEIAMDQRGDQDAKKMVGITRGDPKPAEGETGEPFSDLDYPENGYEK